MYKGYVYLGDNTMLKIYHYIFPTDVMTMGMFYVSFMKGEDDLCLHGCWCTFPKRHEWVKNYTFMELTVRFGLGVTKF